MRKLKAGIIGTGYISVSHIEAIYRLGFAEPVAVTDTNKALAHEKAKEYHIPYCYATVEELLANPEIDVVHNCTPNNMHLEVNRKIIQSGKHVFSEKPLGLNSDESAEMLRLLTLYPSVVHGVNFNYRMNPLVQEMKNRIRQNELGVPKLVRGTYLQDWLLYDTDYSWRLEPEIGGPSNSVADIGSHWMDLAQNIIGSRITSVCADLATIMPVRKKPVIQSGTFSETISGEYEERRIITEDYGAVLFHMENGVRGVFNVAQVCAGRKCRFDIEVNGSEASYYWNQEEADKLWMGRRNSHNMSIMRNPNLMTAEAKPYSYLAAGHPEGWNDAQKNNIFAFYKRIKDGKHSGKPDFATFEDGHYIIKLTEAILQSHKDKCWVNIT